jgi:predicted NAD/FAD-dependent oxidoreductase
MGQHWDVIVVGGGLAGLAAGATATAGGAKTLVLEAGAIGGRARTHEEAGFVFNLGGHAFYLGGAGSKVLSELGIKLAGAKPPLARYKARLGGELHVLPTGPGTLLRTTLLGTRGKAQFGRLLARLPHIDTSGLTAASMQEWLDGLDLRTDVRAVVASLVRITTYSGDLEELSAGAVIGQLQAGSRDGVLYVDGGFSSIVAALAGKVQVRPGTRALTVSPGRECVEVETGEGRLVGRRVILAPGAPAATLALLPDDPGWDDLGGPVIASCLDVGVDVVPSPGYVLGIDEPLYATTQSPPARQAPGGSAVVAVLRYGEPHPGQDRSREELRAFLGHAGVVDGNIIVQRFLPRMIVSSTMPRARNGGLPGRPSVGASGLEGVFVAGDWVGPDGFLTDAALASGRQAGLAALQSLDRVVGIVA